MRILILISVFVFLALPAYAEDDSAYTIKVIQDDGTVQVIDLRPAEPPPEAKKPAPVKKVSAPPQARNPSERVRKTVRRKEPVMIAPKPRKITPGHKPQRPAWPEGQEITKEMASAIALDFAPPAKSMQVFRRAYKDQIVYLVAFKTDDGRFDVLVDAMTGKIIPIEQNE